MNSAELKAERIRHGKRARDMAGALGITYDAYVKKERGTTGFNTKQIIIVATELQMTMEMVNRIFFDSRLPRG